MKSKQKRKVNRNVKETTEKEHQQLSRMLARCASCVKDYIPRGRGETEVSNLKLFYIPNEKLDSNKNSLVCPMHKEKTEPAGLILSEDCLTNQFGSAMGLIAFRFSKSEIEFAKQNQIWPKLMVKSKIQLDARIVSSRSDEELLKLVRSSVLQDITKEDEDN